MNGVRVVIPNDTTVDELNNAVDYYVRESIAIVSGIVEQPNGWFINLAVRECDVETLVDQIEDRHDMYIRHNFITDAGLITNFISKYTKRNHLSSSWLTMVSNSCHLLFKDRQLLAVMGLCHSTVHDCDVLVYPIVATEYLNGNFDELLLYHACLILSSKAELAFYAGNVWNMDHSVFRTYPKGMLVIPNEYCHGNNCTNCTCPLYILCKENVKIIIY